MSLKVRQAALALPRRYWDDILEASYLHGDDRDMSLEDLNTCVNMSDAQSEARRSRATATLLGRYSGSVVFT